MVFGDQPGLLRFWEIVSTGSKDHWFKRLTETLKEARGQEPVDVGSTSTSEGGKGQQGQTSGSCPSVLEVSFSKNNPIFLSPSIWNDLMAKRQTHAKNMQTKKNGKNTSGKPSMKMSRPKKGESVSVASVQPGNRWPSPVDGLHDQRCQLWPDRWP